MTSTWRVKTLGHPSVCFVIHSFVQPFIHLFIHSFIHSIIHLFVRSFIFSKVKDIYGGDYAIMGLPGDVPASSFGKAARTSREDKRGLYLQIDSNIIFWVPTNIVIKKP